MRLVLPELAVLLLLKTETNNRVTMAPLSTSFRDPNAARSAESSPLDALAWAQSWTGPASLILGPLEQIAAHTSEVVTRRQANVALRQTHQLLRSMDRMICLSELQQGRVTCAPFAAEAIAYVREVVETFRSVSQEKGLILTLSVTLDRLVVEFDPLLLVRLLENLLENAVQFTPAGGTIKVKVAVRSEEWWSISVQDTGIGMSNEDFIVPVEITPGAQTPWERPKLGLHLAQRLAKVQRGRLEIKSIEGLGTEVTVQLPRNWGLVTETSPADSAPAFPKGYLAARALLPAAPICQAWDENSSSGNLVLLLDTNADRRDYLRLALEPAYRILEADTEASAQELAVRLRPDAILLGPELPGEGGLAIAKMLKSTAPIAHLPILLLGKADAAFRIAALEAGVDICLDSQISLAELREQLARLLVGRRAYRDHFRAEMIAFSPVTDARPREEQFLTALRQAMAENLTDEHFSVEDLAAKLAMSRTQLHRKLKAICGQSTTTFMRNYRLERAYQLLKQNAGGVGEVAFMVGFGSASYFSKAFTAKFGMSPKEIRKQYPSGGENFPNRAEIEAHPPIRISA